VWTTYGREGGSGPADRFLITKIIYALHTYCSVPRLSSPDHSSFSEGCEPYVNDTTGPYVLTRMSGTAETAGKLKPVLHATP
jgi:hypothetical protein